MSFLRMKANGSVRRKPKVVDKNLQRQLQESWDRILQDAAKPLEHGAVAKGVDIQGLVQLRKPVISVKPKPRIPSLPMGAGGTKPAVDPLADEKRAMLSHVGQVYNKGGPQYLSDADIEEQRSGSHKRR